MGGIGDGRDVMDYRLQFPGVTHFLIFIHDDFFRLVIATAKITGVTKFGSRWD